MLVKAQPGLREGVLTLAQMSCTVGNSLSDTRAWQTPGARRSGACADGSRGLSSRTVAVSKKTGCKCKSTRRSRCTFRCRCKCMRTCRCRLHACLNFTLKSYSIDLVSERLWPSELARCFACQPAFGVSEVEAPAASSVKTDEARLGDLSEHSWRRAVEKGCALLYLWGPRKVVVLVGAGGVLGR